MWQHERLAVSPYTRGSVTLSRYLAPSLSPVSLSQHAIYPRTTQVIAFDISKTYTQQEVEAMEEEANVYLYTMIKQYNVRG